MPRSKEQSVCDVVKALVQGLHHAIFSKGFFREDIMYALIAIMHAANEVSDQHDYVKNFEQVKTKMHHIFLDVQRTRQLEKLWASIEVENKAARELAINLASESRKELDNKIFDFLNLLESEIGDK